ncbi:MAG TPA: SurA N-terminal domain-containing protein [Spongiibacteraceae bacterium]|nr:SurA N-terminal domain-containing protein [Spongiibacteraceae bacterium]
MLQNIRDNIQGVVAKIIIALIIVPFAIFGIESLISGGGAVDVAKVNGEKITEVELQQAIMVHKQQLLAQMGDKIQPSMLDDTALRGPALDNLITQRLLQQSAGNLKLVMPVQVVDQTILSMGAFQDEGKFSPDRYQALLRNQGYTPAYFKHLLQQELVVNQLHSGLSESEFVTSKELQKVAGLLQQQRSFNYVTIPVAPLADKIAPDSKEVEAYYEAHKDQYLSPERVKLEYVELRTQDFAPPLDDKALQAEYDREMAAAKPTTERRAAHILIEINAQRNEQQARELADSIAKKATAGDDFAKLAEQYSDDIGSKNSGGDLGVSDGTIFPPLFEQTLAGMKSGEVSAPFKTSEGFELLKLNEVRTKPLPTFAEKKDEIEQRIMREKALPELTKTVEKLRDLVFNSDGLSGPAAELKLTVKTSDWLERKNTDPLLSNGKLMAAAFSAEVLNDHNNSDVIELTPDHYVVVRVKEHEAAAPKALASVAAEVVSALKLERAREQSKKIAEEISQRLSQGEDFKKTAAGYSAQSVERAMRGGGSVSPDLLRAAFAMPRPVAGKPLPVDTVAIANGDVALLQLSDVIEGQPESLSEAQRNAVTAQLRQGYGTADFAMFMDGLHKTADIKRH